MPAKRSIKPFLWACATIAIVVGIVMVGMVRLRPAPQAVVALSSATLPARVIAGNDYYVFVRLVEFNPEKPTGGRWDSGDSSAPDAYVRLFWQGNRVFESADRKNALIATWDVFRVDVQNLIIGDGTLDIASALNGPVVRVEHNIPLTIEVWDDDPVGDDLALKLDVPLDTLSPGENTLTPQDTGIKRIVLQLVDRKTPTAELLDMASKR